MSVFRYLETWCLAAAYRGGPDPDPERTVRGADPWAQAEATQALDLRLRGCPWQRSPQPGRGRCGSGL